MNFKILNIAIYTIILLLLSSCASTTTLEDDTTTEPSKSASLHYKDIKRSITIKNLILADRQYLEMRGEYPESMLLPDAILALALAHMEAKEYLLSKYYCDSYGNDYPSGIRRDYAVFLKIQGTYRQFIAISGGQQIADQMDRESRQFMRDFRRSKYISKVKSMRKKFKIIRKKRNEDIAKMYERTGKTKAAEYYRKKNR